jgi:pimeloyl-ACP methyl ester carboxylesterase
MGGLLAMKLAEVKPISALVLLSPALPAELLEPPPSHMVRLLPRQYRRELIGWDGPVDVIQRQNPDLTSADVMRVQHMMGMESGQARREMLEGVPVSRDELTAVPTLVIGAGLDHAFPEGDSERLAEWLAPTISLWRAFPLRPGNRRGFLRAGRRASSRLHRVAPPLAARGRRLESALLVNT